MTSLPRYLQREFERDGDKPRVLVEYQKNGTIYWNATGDRLFSVALEILKNRVKYHAIPSAEAVRKWKERETQPELTKEQIEALPPGKVKEAAIVQFSQALSQRAEYDRMIQQAEQANQALDTQDGVLAWVILSNRSGYEYERVELQVLLNPEDPEISS